MSDERGTLGTSVGFMRGIRGRLTMPRAYLPHISEGYEPTPSLSIGRMMGSLEIEAYGMGAPGGGLTGSPEYVHFAMTSTRFFPKSLTKDFLRSLDEKSSAV
jgi:hypothetical protein